MNIYPTLIDLCELPTPENPQGQTLEGISMRPLLANPDARWKRPALTTHGRNNHALRSQHYRYIRYADGGEELYDHRADPMEYNNLAENSKMADVKNQMAAWLPKTNVPEAPRDKTLSKSKKK
jgi:arylsulfatase A-like enzyme